MLMRWVGEKLSVLCAQRALTLPIAKVIANKVGDVYLIRYHLWSREWAPFRLYLHEIQRSDEDPELHNHPWSWALCFILAGGYREERRTHTEPPRIATRTVGPLRFNILLPDTFHRVDLLENVSWSLVLVGPRIQEWSFWNRTTRVRLHWKDFIRSKGLVPLEG